MAFFLLSQGFRHRVVIVHRFYRNVSSDGKRFFRSVLALIIVEIQICVRSHDDIVSETCGFDSAFLSPPRHDDDTVSGFSFKDFIPADNLLAMGLQEFGHVFHDMPLQFLLLGGGCVVFQSQFIGLGLAFRTILPSDFRTFVASDMYVRRREEFHDFGEHPVEEFENGVIAGTQYVIGNSPFRPYLVRSAGTSQFRISRKGSLHVTRKVDLRNDGDVSVRRIFYDFPDLLLSIIAAVRLAVILLGAVIQMSDKGLVPHRTFFYEFRIAFDFHPPALVIRNVPVEHVHVVQRHHVYVCLHFVYREEMAAYVKMRPAIAEMRVVRDFRCREKIFSVAGSGGRKGFPQHLDSIEYSGGSRCRNGDSF